MRISRRFTKPGCDVYSLFEWTTRSSRISNSDGSTVFEMKDAQVPAGWSQLATDIVVSKYFRKAGVPQVDESGRPKRDASGGVVTGPERSARQVVHRLAGCWRAWGEKHGYFSSLEDAQAFYDELAYMLLAQMAAPNSPQWFNTGLSFAYGITGPAQGHWIADPATGAVRLADDAYSHPQPHACFIQSVRDDLVGEGGIMDLWTREARLFKYGSGTGTNFSQLRGDNEPLSGGGRSSGLMSFLKIGDRAAGAIKSGGTTRRAAKMVCLDVDHPDIEEFVNWKVREELKVAALVEGLKKLPKESRDLAESLRLRLDYDFNGEAYLTVSGQNSNNSVRLTDAFLDAVAADADWTLIRRTDGKPAKTIKARDLWKQIVEAAWRCADPGVQYDTTINAWHTCPAGGRINASNPCSEYMFLDNTACNLASINLLKFLDPKTRRFDWEGYEHATSLWTVVLEISVLMASFPSREIAALSWRYRTLGLGYANLGAMLMQCGIPYDSEEGRALCGALTSILTGRSYATSALLAAEHGACAGFAENRDSMLRVIRNHRRAALGVPRTSDQWEDLRIRPVPIDHDVLRDARLATRLRNAGDLLDRAVRAWDDALALGQRHGFRNAQVSVIAPTGTIGLLMDCDTTGVEPDFALTKFKKLAGGGYFKIANQSLRPALAALGYEASQIDEILIHVMGRLSLDAALPAADGRPTATSFRDWLAEQGFTSEELVAIENQLPSVFELKFAFSAWSLPERIVRSLGLDPDAARQDMAFNGLRALGLNARQIERLNRDVCGTQTVEGAPHLRAEHLPVFDCANRCGPLGTRFIASEGHIRMMAAAQPFISGAISKTINLPAEAPVDDIAACYQLSWELGLKANALYRDGCKLSQPLSTKSDSAEEAAKEELSPEEDAAADSAASESAATGAASVAEVAEPRFIERIIEKVIERPMRRRLPDTRESITHKFNVAGHEGYLIVGLYEDGSPGELFITMAKEGSTIGGLMDSLGTAISVALQYGVPVESLVTKFAHQRFEPMGMTTNADIPFAKSLVDYIFRWLGMQFIDGYRERNAPARSARLATAGESVVSEPRPVQEERAWNQPRTDPRPDRVLGAAPVVSRSDEPDSAIPLPGSSGAAVARSSPRVVVSEQYAEVTETVEGDRIRRTTVVAAATSSLDQSNANLMGDAPACDVCGSITVRNGSCYRCLNCGQSMGCS
ncbi:MAG: adenosylcobalamin-dependent ribonucleoside-diphosphate reductase [Phycisphaerae bacterium]|nr:adenosylcobalamin-dependent ribonucleoside-diphosphate reductase [Phycisphaerae bacterium]